MIYAKVNIVGIGPRKTGTGKNGKPYDFSVVNFTYEDDKHFEGLNVGSCILDTSVIESFKIIPNKELNVVLGFKDYKSYILAVND